MAPSKSLKPRENKRSFTCAVHVYTVHVTIVEKSNHAPLQVGYLYFFCIKSDRSRRLEQYESNAIFSSMHFENKKNFQEIQMFTKNACGMKLSTCSSTLRSAFYYTEVTLKVPNNFGCDGGAVKVVFKLISSIWVAIFIGMHRRLSISLGFSSSIQSYVVC